MKRENSEKIIRSSAAECLTFAAASGDSQNYEDENIWLTQKMMAALYDVEPNTITYHIQQIFEDRELSEDPTTRNFRVVHNEGKRQVSRNIKHYSLQMIIAVGFKVNSERAVQSLKWVNRIAALKWKSQGVSIAALLFHRAPQA